MREYKRVRTLYRVSTKKQLDDNDIPMQRNACQDFVKGRSDWAIEKEYIEKGVSGYHISANDRDVVQEIRQDVLDDAFDILLVFMFDRIGRREDETPFLVEWFIAHGIEVWSVKEGQQRIENRNDKLLNYIRYWQSGGESEKTSLRVSEKHRQMVEDGQYRGGSAPLGYRLVKTGKINKKGYETKELEIDDAEADLVRLIFDLYTKKGYGAMRISKYLNEKGYKTNRGNIFTYPSVSLIIQNPIYIGDYVGGKRKSTRGSRVRTNRDSWTHSRESQDHLAVIDIDTWEKAQKIRESRAGKKKSDTSIPVQTKSALLYTGMARCGYCGSKLYTKYKVKSYFRQKDRTEVKYTVQEYSCPQRNVKKECSGQTCYSSKKLEGTITPIIFEYIQDLEKIDLAPSIQHLKNEMVTKYEVEIGRVCRDIEEPIRALTRMENEIAAALEGKSAFDKDTLSNVIGRKKIEIAALREREASLRSEAASRQLEIDKFVKMEQIIPDWIDGFQKASTEEKKMMLADIIDVITVYRDTADVRFKYNFLRISAEDGINE